MAQAARLGPARKRRAHPSDEAHRPHPQKARESPYTQSNEKHESEEVFRRRAFLRDASTFLRRRLEDPISARQLAVQF